jgi:CheY-specific phosphatase CheX
MNKKVGLEIASGMMGGMQLAELDEISKSAISELTNMILGNTATILYNKGINIDITPPSFLMGENLQVSNSKVKTFVYLWTSQMGVPSRLIWQLKNKLQLRVETLFSLEVF